MTAGLQHQEAGGGKRKSGTLANGVLRSYFRFDHCGRVAMRTRPPSESMRVTAARLPDGAGGD